MTVESDQPLSTSKFEGEEPKGEKGKVHPLKANEFLRARNGIFQVGTLIMIMYVSEIVCVASAYWELAFWIYGYYVGIIAYLLFLALMSLIAVIASVCGIIGAKKFNTFYLTIFQYYNIFGMIYNIVFLATPLSYYGFLKIAIHSRLRSLCIDMKKTLSGWNENGIEAISVVNAMKNLELQNRSIQKDLIIAAKLETIERVCCGKLDSRKGTLIASVSVLIFKLIQIVLFNFIPEVSDTWWFGGFLNPIRLIGIISASLGIIGAKYKLRVPTSAFYVYNIIALLGNCAATLVAIIMGATWYAFWENGGIAFTVVTVVDLPLTFVFLTFATAYNKVLYYWQEEETIQLSKLEALEIDKSQVQV